MAVEPLVVLGLYFAQLGASAVDGTPVAVVGPELLETAADSGWAYGAPNQRIADMLLPEQ